MEELISKELLSLLGYGKVTYIGDVSEFYTMNCLMFKCDTTRTSGRDDGKNIITNKSFYVALDVLGNRAKDYVFKEYGISVTSKKEATRIDSNLNYHFAYLFKGNEQIKRICSYGNDMPMHNYFTADIKACEWILENKAK